MGFLVFFCGVGKRDYDFKEINVKVFNFFNRFKFFGVEILRSLRSLRMTVAYRHPEH